MPISDEKPSLLLKNACTFACTFLKMDNKKTITTDSGEAFMAQVPVIVSASRATDIPAFYAEWFFDRLQKGYIVWKNPYSGKPVYVSFENTRLIVFWSKNPEPLIQYLPLLKERGIGCYIQYTLNDYQRDGLEPNVPDLSKRIDTFHRLADILGIGSVVWRFDPLLLTKDIGVQDLLEKVSGIADRLAGYTEKLVFSFADIAGYKKVHRNLTTANIPFTEWTEDGMMRFASELSRINDERWHYELATCAERIDLSPFGISHNRCIDPGLMMRLAPNDPVLANYLYHPKKDKGQRALCGCTVSKDIGTYNTCPHGCLYCYANTSPQSAVANYYNHLKSLHKESIL